MTSHERYIDQLEKELANRDSTIASLRGEILTLKAVVAGYVDQHLIDTSALYTTTARIAKQDVIISKLPKTADGVPFLHGVVYVNGYRGGVPHTFEYPAEVRWIGNEPYIAFVCGQKIEQPYSTRVAALASLSPPKKPDQ